VTRVAEYGAVIELEEGLSGLLHASEMVAPDGTEVNPSVQYAPGTQVTVRPPPGAPVAVAADRASIAGAVPPVSTESHGPA